MTMRLLVLIVALAAIATTGLSAKDRFPNRLAADSRCVDKDKHPARVSSPKEKPKGAIASAAPVAHSGGSGRPFRDYVVVSFGP